MCPKPLRPTTATPRGLLEATGVPAVVALVFVVAVLATFSGLAGCAGSTGAAKDAMLSANPSVIDFGRVTTGSNASQAVGLSNPGEASLTITQATVSGNGFAIGGLTLPLTIAPGGSSAFTTTFTPSSTGSVTGAIVLSSNASTSPMNISLTGTGVAPAVAQLTAGPANLNFGNVQVGAVGTQSGTITNTGSASATVSLVTVTGTGYNVSGIVQGQTVAAGQSVPITVTFSPTSTGSVGGSISVTSNASNSPTNISLAGTGTAASTPQLTASVASLNFGNVEVGNTGTQNESLTNTGSANVTISLVAVTGSGYSVSGVSQGQTITGGQSVPVTVTFTPTTTGSAAGSISITSNASNSPTVISLAGGSHLVSLSWSASTTSTVVGYNIYRGTQGNGTYPLKLNLSLLSGTTFTDTSVVAGQTYYYAVTAVDSTGIESGYSSPASASIPTP
jgi:HYDIN/CFA65/VesB-like, Ig-like domain/Abnormal spindle-like microcephaly-assoc'd, ASPM-SPD-2-Hydin/Cep192 domain 4